MSKKTAITPTRMEDYAQWYQQVIKAAELAETSSVRGCMVIRPWGYALWENVQRQLDQRLKALGHENFYCPLFIPLSHLEKEAQHIDGFAKECAVVTHHRLEKGPEGRLVPAGELEEPLIVRPTSETIIGEVYSGWVQSYRDLPILMNQWANVVRWEMRTRLFLRTTEFLWQEGHTVHANAEEAMAETLLILNVYYELVNDVLAMPVIKGEKSESERFPGAVNTYCIEGMMQDKKALQAGTSHFLGQHFSKAFNIQFLNAEGAQEFGWTTSWGASTRLIGGLIMTHSDDDGLVLPPRIAPLHVVILPIIHDESKRASIYEYCDQLAAQLSAQSFYGDSIKVKIDQREMRGGEKAWHWVKKGVPVRIEVGAKELEAKQLSVSRRDQAYNERKLVDANTVVSTIVQQLTDIQNNIYQRAKTFRDENTHSIESEAAFYQFFKENDGFISAYWAGDAMLEAKIKDELSVTIRCLPLEDFKQGRCIFTGKETKCKAIFARAY